MNKFGSLKIYIGPMFSGKTSIIMDEYMRYTIGGKKCLFVKYSNDIRFVDSYTHDRKYQFINNNNEKYLPNNMIFNEIKCLHLFEIDNFVNDYDVIIIDEIQFFEDNYIFCEKWANQGMIVRVAGLISTYERKMFVGMEKLLPKAEEIEYKYAVCENSGKNAEFTSRIVNNENIILIGGLESYKPVDRQTYFKLLENNKKFEYMLDQFDQFKIIYQKVNNLNYDVDCIKLEKIIQDNININNYNINFLNIINELKL